MLERVKNMDDKTLLGVLAKEMNLKNAAFKKEGGVWGDVVPGAPSGLVVDDDSFKTHVVETHTNMDAAADAAAEALKTATTREEKTQVIEKALKAAGASNNTKAVVIRRIVKEHPGARRLLREIRGGGKTAEVVKNAVKDAVAEKGGDVATGKLSCNVGDEVLAQYCRFKGPSPTVGKLGKAKIVAIHSNNTLTVNWASGQTDCRNILPYQAGVGKPDRKLCGKIPDSCTPKDKTGVEKKVGKFGRCLASSQCQSGMYCCPYFKSCLPNDGTPLSGNWLKEHDKERFDMIYGAKRPCKKSWCDVCGVRGEKPTLGLCNSFSMNGKEGFKTTDGSFWQAYDPTNKRCACQAAFLEKWRLGQWVVDIGGAPTCDSDPVAVRAEDVKKSLQEKLKSATSVEEKKAVIKKLGAKATTADAKKIIAKEGMKEEVSFQQKFC